MAEEPQDQVEEGEDVDKLLGEFGSLYAALTKHQRPMAILFADLKGSTAIFGERSDRHDLGGQAVLVSIAHEGDIAMAQAVAVG